MKRFEVLKRLKNLDTNEVDVEYQFAINGDLVKKAERFKDLDSANIYLLISMRDWLLSVLDLYIVHKKMIIEAGKHTNQAAALEKCHNAVGLFINGRKSLDTICDQVIKGASYFRAILPHPNNDSWQRSEQDLNEILTFCKNWVEHDARRFQTG